MRANRVRVLLFSAAGAGVVTAAYYGRRYYQLIQTGLEAEREEGARRLRARYVANAAAASQAATALLPLLVTALKESNLADVDGIVAALKADGGKDKVRRFELLRDATFVEFVGTAYIIACLSVAVCLQANLVRRDESRDPTVRETYHAVVGARLERGVTELIETVSTVVKEIGKVPLKRRVQQSDVKELCVSILHGVRASPPSLLQPDYLYDSENTTPEVSDAVAELLDESADLAVTLDAPAVVWVVACHVLDLLLNTVEWKASAVPCAAVLSPLHSAATTILTELPTGLQRLPAVERLGAAVFLSGEAPAGNTRGLH